MIFNGYWWDCEPEEQEAERKRQLVFRRELLAAAVVTFFPEFDEFKIVCMLTLGSDHI